MSPSSSVAHYGRWAKKVHGKDFLYKKSNYLLNTRYFKQANFSVTCPKQRVLVIEMYASSRCKS